MKKGKKMDKKGRMAFNTMLAVLILVVLTLPVSAQVVVKVDDTATTMGGIVTVPIMVNDVINLATGNVNLTYNPSVVHVTEVKTAAGNALTVQAWNIDNTTGVVRIASMDVYGKSGDVIFADITLKAVGSEGSSSPLNIEIVTLADTSYQSVPATVVNGTFNVGMAGIATPTPITTPTLTPTPAAPTSAAPISTPSPSPILSSTPTPGVTPGVTPAVTLTPTPTPTSAAPTLMPSPSPRIPGFEVVFGVAALMVILLHKVALKRKKYRR